MSIGARPASPPASPPAPRPAAAGGLAAGRDGLDGRAGADGRPLRVTTVITRLEGGAGVLALRGIKAVAAALVSPGDAPGGRPATAPAIAPTIVTGSGGPLLDEARAAGIEVLVEPSLREVISPRSDLRALGQLEAIFRRLGSDVVHTHCAKAGAVGRLAARRAGVPRIVHTFHGFPFHEFQSAARRRAYVAIERRLGQFTDLALCVGPAVAAEAARRELIAPERIRTIGVAVDGPGRARADMSARLPQARRRARLALGLPPDVPVVGSVGRLTYQKAPEDFVAALQRLGRPDAVGVWVGSGELADRVRRLGLTASGPRIVLAGERADVLDLLPAFDVFALPSRYEGLPTVIVEAMICGVPVVATAVNAVHELVVPGETGLLVPPRRPVRLAAAIRYLLDVPEEAGRMAEAARARLGDQHSEPALAAALISAYAPAGRAATEYSA
jgi:glycosyltransferase involved in cell wall biosynthesis